MSAAPSWSQPGYGAVAAWLGGRTGLTFPDGRVADAEAGIRRAMLKADAADLVAYLRDLEAGRADLDELIAELVVGESYFFREPLQCALIREEVLPVLRRSRPAGQGLRFWSAGCASGEEPYTLAILLEEAGLAASTHILATDLSRAALGKADVASYSPWSLRGVDPSVIARYFSPDGPRWLLRRRLRERVHLEQLNLGRDPYPSFANGTWRMDLILCRNVLIYLDPDTVRRVCAQLHECLAPGGWLITGPSDPLIDDEGRFERVVTRAGLAYRRAAAANDTEPAAQPSPPSNDPGWEHRPPPLSPSLRAGRESAKRAGTAAPDPLAEARAALARGDYDAVLAQAGALPDAAAAALCVRAVANGKGAAAAERLVHASIARHPRSEELQLLRAVLLMDLGRHKEAAQAARRALYLDRALAMGHFLLGSALARVDDRAGAHQAFRNARNLCAQLPPETPVRFADGERAARLAEAAEAQLELLAPRRAS